MADVGVLNLQIQADASQAATSLDSLAGALRRVKTAVGKGLSFGKLPTQLKNLKEALGTDWSGAEKFKTSMITLKEGVQALSGFGAAGKMTDTAKALSTLAKAVTEYSNAINAAGLGKTKEVANSQGNWRDNMAGAAQSQKRLIPFNMQYFAKGSGTADSPVKEATNGVNEVNNALKDIDTSAIGNIQTLVNTLKELKGLSGVGTTLKNIAEGLNAIAGVSKGAKVLSDWLKNDAGGLAKLNQSVSGLKIPSFDNLIKLYQAMHEGAFASVEMKRMAEAMNELKAASDGFKMPSTAGITKFMDAMQKGDASNSNMASGMQNVEAVANNVADALQNVEQTSSQGAGVSAQITDLMAQLSAPVDYSGLSSFVDQMTGVGQSANVTKEEVAVFVTEASRRISELMQALENPGSTGKLKDFIDFNLGGGRSFKSTIDDWKELFEIGEAADTAREKLVQMEPVLESAEQGFYRIRKIGEGPNAKLEFVKVDPAGEQRKIQETFDRIQSTAEDRITKLRQMFGNSPLRVQEEIAGMAGMSVGELFGNSAGAVQQTGDAMGNIIPTIQNGMEAMNGYADATNNARTAIHGMTQESQQTHQMPATDTTSLESAIEQVDMLVNSMSSDQAQIATAAYDIENRINELAATEAQLRMELAQDIQAQGQDAAAIGERAAQIRMLQTEQAQLYQQLLEMQQAQKSSTRVITALRNAFDDLRQGMHNLPFVRLLSQMARMAKMRALRYMIRELAKGFREGVENVYHYSEAIGSSFAPTMDSAATAMNQMKNSIGAAVAPALQALIPLFNQIVNWVITAVNYVNQLISLLSGKSTWTKALPVATKAFEEQKKSAKGASDAVKDMLADFDELNIIQQQSGSGSGSNAKDTAKNYEEMFTEEENFEKSIQDIAGWIQDHMELIKDIAGDIGVAILGWKISKAFDGVLGRIARIAAGVALVITGVKIGQDAGFDAGLNGFNDTNIAESILGAVAAGVGGYLVFGAAGAIVGIAIYTGIWLDAYYKGRTLASYISTFGQVVLDADQLKNWVQSMFNFPIDAYINIMDTAITNDTQAKQNLNDKIAAFSLTLKKVMLHIDDSPEALNQLQIEANDAIAQFKVSNEQALNTVTVNAQMGGLVDSEGNPLTITSVAQFGLDLERLNEGAEFAGMQLAMWISKGISDGLDATTEEMIQKYSNYVALITSAGEIGEAQSEFMSTVAVDMSQLSYKTLLEGLTGMNEEADKYVNKRVALAVNEIANKERAAKESAILAQMYTDEAENAKTVEEAEMYANKAKEAAEAAERLSNEAAEGRKGLGKLRQETNEFAKSYMQEQLRELFKDLEMFNSEIDGVKMLDDIIKESHGDQPSVLFLLDQYFSGEANFDATDIGGFINDRILSTLQNKNYELGDAVWKTGLSGWDVLTTSDKADIYYGLKNTYGYNRMTEFMRDAFQLSASDLFEISNWEKLTNEEKAQFIQSMTNAFDANDVLNALHGKDIFTIEDLINYIGSPVNQLSLEERHMLLSSLTDLFDRDTIYQYLLGAGNGRATVDQWMEEALYNLPDQNAHPGFTWPDEIPEIIIEDDLSGRTKQFNGLTVVGDLPTVNGFNVTDGGTRLFARPGVQSVWNEEEDENNTRTAAAAEGTKVACDAQNNKLDTLINLLRVVAAKDFTVNLSPTSTVGGFVGKAISAFSNVTGE